jgi:hypothetical protein
MNPQGSHDGAVTGCHGRTSIHARPCRTHTGTQLPEGSGIRQDVDPFPGGELTSPMLSFDMLDTTAEKIFFLDFMISF